MSGGDLFVQMFRCCVTEDQTRSHHQTRRRIDRSMIGNPTNFRHTAHIGTSDLMGPSSSNNNQMMGEIHCQMKSKGGYESSTSTMSSSSHQQTPGLHVPSIINARSLDEVRRK
ncbi:hypothetical protein TCAL_07103 [Tigriopus californicus]|uniref:CRIB domain-containing protein n=1 Tax=Tigriopus californicus TaxID=6832 RepID=A0A553PCQ0_TIGCA|nr:hypothetical protein TCAL_07103 [Tigriopus californicus]|eukprot:TCALIF_07103-PA protein Name:"Similar to Spec2 CDC42 small effector protein homolog (Drosophila melanogaster)" AED:0.00 eAED:0.07 QI:0/-1/0/1/-1/1/1/0/112